MENEPRNNPDERGMCMGTSCNGCKQCNYDYEELRVMSADWQLQPDQLYAAEARIYFFYYLEHPEFIKAI